MFVCPSLPNTAPLSLRAVLHPKCSTAQAHIGSWTSTLVACYRVILHVFVLSVTELFDSCTTLSDPVSALRSVRKAGPQLAFGCGVFPHMC
eukprot:5849725-Alexandrium_andersonii.AAC.1